LIKNNSNIYVFQLIEIVEIFNSNTLNIRLSLHFDLERLTRT